MVAACGHKKRGAAIALHKFKAQGIRIKTQRGFEIVDKLARKEIFIEGAVAESFQRGVQELVRQGPNEEMIDDYIAGFTALAQQPVVLH